MTARSDSVTEKSWLPVAPDSDFSLANLPYGSFRRSPGEQARVGVAIGEYVFDLTEAARCGLFDRVLDEPRALFHGPTLNSFLGAGHRAWKRTRERLVALLSTSDTEVNGTPLADRLIVERDQMQLQLPLAVGDYIDFYSSLQHATNLGRIFRPDGDALTANWRHLPIGYHGRAGSIVLSGTPIQRPAGQHAPRGSSDLPRFGPTNRLDMEVELAFITGDGKPRGEPITADEAEQSIFGFVLLNDWSARDIQAWEYVPLGPFLGKSFATSISPWIVPLAALEPYRRPAPEQVPPVLPYLRTDADWALDIDLSVELRTGDDRAAGRAGTIVAAMNPAGLYWTPAQQLAHASSNGARIRAGDLFASGTISGDSAAERGSLIELTWNGTAPLVLSGGAERTFLEDGDEVTIRGAASATASPRIGFGEVRGEVLPYRAPDDVAVADPAPRAVVV